MMEAPRIISKRLVAALLLLATPLLVAPLLAPLFVAEAQDPKPAVGKPPEQTPHMESGPPLERSISGGQRHAYTLTGERDQFLRIVTEQLGIDVAVHLFGPAGEQLAAWDGPTGEYGPESISLLIPESGVLRFEVVVEDPRAAGGSYRITIDGPRPAEARDRLRIAAEGTFAEATRLRRSAGSPEDYRAALRLHGKALQLYRELQDDYGQGLAAHFLGICHRRLNELPEALRAFKLAADLRRQADDPWTLATSLTSVGWVYVHTGRLEEALPPLEEALQLRRKVGDDLGEVITLNDLAHAYRELGELQKAIDDFEAALALSRRIQAQLDEAIVLGQLARLERYLGRPRQAVEQARASLDLFRQLGDRLGESSSLFELAKAQRALGDLATGLPLLRQAAEIARQEGMKEIEAKVHLALAKTLLDLARIEEAAAEIEAVRAAGTVGAGSTILGELELTIGAVRLAKGELGGAREAYENAVRAWREMGAIVPEAAALAGLARVERRMGHLRSALEKVQAATEILESLRTSLLSPELRADFFASYRPVYELYIDVLMELHDQEPNGAFSARALAVSERARARSLLEMLTEAGVDLRRDVPPELLEEEERLRRRLNVLEQRRARIWRAGNDDRQLAPIEHDIASLLERLQVFRTQIRAASPRYAALSFPEPLDAPRIQRLLREGELLLEFFTGKDGGYCWLVSRDSLKSFHLPGRNTLQAEVEAFRQAMQTSRSVLVGRQHAEAGARLSRWLLTSIAGRLRRETKLIIVADGPLHYLPFAALPLPAGESEGEARQPLPTLLTLAQVTYLPSASVVPTLRESKASIPLRQGRLMVVADPVFDRHDPRLATRLPATSPEVSASEDDTETHLTRAARDFGVRTFPRLPHTRAEAQHIAKVTIQRRRQVLLDFAARREELTGGSVRDFQLLHFATHGLLDEVHPELSGLVFSLIDENGEPLDGFLRVHEIYELELSAQLVVLSACETALGKLIEGEGIVGLTRAFLNAGTPSVIASLWRVDDPATAEFMGRFYEALFADGLHPSAALRAAQLRMLQNPRYRRPYYWAGFVLQGNWR